MNEYEEMLQEANDNGVKVHESFDLNGDEETDTTIDALYMDGNVALDKRLKTSVDRSCKLAEELGHHLTTVGNIIDLSDAQNAKQERQARLWSYNRKIGLYGLIKACEHGCKESYEIAEYLNVTVKFLEDAVECYKGKYGEFTIVDNYVIYFIPNLGVLKMI